VSARDPPLAARVFAVTVEGTAVTDAVIVSLARSASDVDDSSFVTSRRTNAAVVVVSPPTTVTAKTLAANGGSLADTGTSPGAGFSDFVMIETTGQTAGVPAATTATTTSSNTVWSRMAGLNLPSTYMDTATQGGLAFASRAADGRVGMGNTPFVNMDTFHQNTSVQYTTSYYVTIRPRTNSNVIDQGAYTFQFQLVDANGVVRGTKTVKIDFVSAASKSDAVLTLTPTGTFLVGAALASYDSATADSYASATLRNRDAGLVRNFDGTPPAILSTVQLSTTAAPGFIDTITVVNNDSGTYGLDYGTNSATSPGNGSLQAQDGIYGLTWAASVAPVAATSATAGAVRSYRWQIGYGNATLLTPALTVFAASGSGTASAANTDALVTAAGMKAADQLVKTNAATQTWTVPTTTKTATVKFWIQTSSDTATPAAAITVTPTWSGTFGTASVSPATSTTGTVYTTDALGNISVTVTNDAPVAGASVALVLTGGLAFGAGTYTATINWAKPVATTIDVADPITGVYVKTGSTNVTTVIVKDQFGNPVEGEAVRVSLSSTSANYSATTTIAPITTGAAGTATYSLVGGATTATLDAITFTSVTSGATAPMTYNYVATVPAVATMVAYHGYSHATAGTTLTPATGIYQSGTTTELVLRSNRDLSKSLLSFADSTADDMINLRFYALAAGSVAATGAVVTVTAGEGGHILDASGLPVKSRNFLVTSTGYTGSVQVLATGTGAVTFTATSGTVTATAAMWVANATGDARFVKITSAATGTANGSGTPVTVTATDRYGNAVSGVALNVVASGVGSFMGGNITQSFTTDSAGTYTFLANTTVSEGGVAKFTVTSGTASTSMADAAGYVGTTAVDATLAAGNSSASTSITFAAGASASDVAQTATDAAAEATDAANAATDAANAAAEAADAATAAAQDAADAVAALSAQVATLISGLKSQLTALTNLVIKIQKKVKA